MRERHDLSWRRVAVIALVLALVVGSAIGLPWWLGERRHARELEAAKPHATPATDAQQAAIARAVLEGHRFGGVPPPPPPPPSRAGEPARVDEPIRYPMVIDETMAIEFCPDATSMLECVGAPGTPNGNWVYSDDPSLREIPRKLRQELVLANAAVSAQPDPAMPGVRLLDSGKPWPSDWDAFYERYPESTGRLQFSRAVLDGNATSALVYAWNGCGAVCGEGWLILLERRGEGWVISQKLNIASA